MTTWIALMRGINVGGRNRISMADLSSVFTDAGARNVETFIQSGNVVFDATEAAAPKIRAKAAKLLLERRDMDAPIVIRSASDFRAAVDRNPFADEGVDPETLHLGFLLDMPVPDAVASIDHARSDVDRFRIVGSEVYLHIPGGVARTRLTSAFFDRALGTVLTVRNWRTTTRLLELLESR